MKLACGAIAVPVLAAAALTGCGGSDASTAATTKKQPRKAARGMSSALTVRVSGGADLRVALFAAPLGKPVTRSRTGDIRRRVHAGNYTLVGRDGDVSCSAPLRVPPAAAVAATVHPAGHDPCFIRVEYLSFGDLIGKDLKLAGAAASRRGFLLRVVRRKGRSVPHTLDLRFDRVNVDVERGEVRGVDGVY